jgi:hypothetical protein
MKKIKWFIKWIGYRISCLLHGYKQPMTWDEFSMLEHWADFEKNHPDKIVRINCTGFVHIDEYDRY